MKEIVKCYARILFEWVFTILLIGICLNLGFGLYKLSELVWGV